MGIAQAIERVRRQAKHAGLGAVIEGVGEQLRSTAVPTPLRGAAWRLAALLDAAKPKRGAAPGQRARELIQQDRAAIDAAKQQTSAARVGGQAAGITSAARPPAQSEVVPVPSRGLDTEVRPTASDTGASPAAPDQGCPVSAAAVGATPTFNATPIIADAIDATPVDDAASDALETIVEVAATASVATTGDTPSERAGSPIAADSEPAESLKPNAAASAENATSEAKPHKARPKNDTRKRATPPPADAQPEKEKLADPGEAAKTLARSNSRGAKRRSGARANASKKK